MDKKFTHYTRQAKTDTQINDRSLWHRFWRDDEGHITIWQFPNIWLILWFIFEVISLLVSSQHTALISWWIATAGLSVWALLEIFKGVNYFRRVLGLCVAILMLLSIFGVGL